MEARISLITLGVDNLERSLRFYRDGLGLPTTWGTERGVVFFKLSGTALSIFPRDELAKDARMPTPEPRPEFSGITLAHNVRTQPEVDALIERAVRAGGKLVKAGQKAEWGGYSGYFADPDGHLWEVAYGAFEFKADGSLDIP